MKAFRDVSIEPALLNDPSEMKTRGGKACDVPDSFVSETKKFRRKAGRSGLQKVGRRKAAAGVLQERQYMLMYRSTSQGWTIAM